MSALSWAAWYMVQRPFESHLEVGDNCGMDRAGM